jgi:TetR/AcrR family transcriptional regulator, tetracycline repressor protein
VIADPDRTGSGRPTRARGPAAMSPERIIEAARDMIESVGIEALSMRKLSAELGVAPTAIYWHVGSRDALLQAVFDRMLQEVPAIEPAGITAADRVASVAHAIRSQVRDTPTVHQLAMHLGRTADASFPGQVALAREVSRAGLTGDEAADFVRAILFLIGGFQLLEGTFRARPEGARTTQELWRGVDDPAIDPVLRAALSEATDADGVFDYALDRLLRSVLPR